MEIWVVPSGGAALEVESSFELVGGIPVGKTLSLVESGESAISLGCGELFDVGAVEESFGVVVGAVGEDTTDGSVSSVDRVDVESMLTAACL